MNGIEILLIYCLLIILASVLGGLIPIFQGWVFGIPGLIILADYLPPVKKLLTWAKKKYAKDLKEKKN